MSKLEEVSLITKVTQLYVDREILNLEDNDSDSDNSNSSPIIQITQPLSLLNLNKDLSFLKNLKKVELICKSE